MYERISPAFGRRWQGIIYFKPSLVKEADSEGFEVCLQVL